MLASYGSATGYTGGGDEAAKPDVEKFVMTGRAQKLLTRLEDDKKWLGSP